MNTQIHPKVSATLLAAAVTGIIVAELSRRGVPIDAAEGSNITMLVSFIAGWMMPGADATLPVAQSPDVPASQSPPAQPNPGAQP